MIECWSVLENDWDSVVGRDKWIEGGASSVREKDKVLEYETEEVNWTIIVWGRMILSVGVTEIGIWSVRERW